jgi:DNA invertase Pin-like site-specific DNA recombinase
MATPVQLRHTSPHSEAYLLRRCCAAPCSSSAFRSYRFARRGLPSVRKPPLIKDPKEERMKRAAIYTRVGTTDQHPEMQQQELIRYLRCRNWKLYKTYGDKVSGAIEKRPRLDALLDDCRRRRIDIVVVWKFDRFARSLKQLVNALDLFRQLGIGFVSCTEAIDTSLPHGEMLFQIIGAIAQWERSLIAERVRAGLQHARSKGKRWGVLRAAC